MRKTASNIIIVDKCVSLFARCSVPHPHLFENVFPPSAETFCCSGVKISPADNVFVTYFYISTEICDIWL